MGYPCGKQPIFLAIFFKMAGELAEHITLLLPDIAAPRHSKKRPCFLEAIFSSLHKPRQACQEGCAEK